MELDISEVSTLTRQALSHLLDAPDRLGKDWCLLAVKMGLTDKVSISISQYTIYRQSAFMCLHISRNDIWHGNIFVVGSRHHENDAVN